MADDHEDHSWILDDELAALFSSPKKSPDILAALLLS